MPYTTEEMALPPTIPTSFVPHLNEAPRKFRSDLMGAFDFAAYAVLGVVFLLALGVFFYGRLLDSEKASKDEKIQAAVAAIDLRTVESFVHLRDRLSSGKTLLEGHTAFSTFFASLEKILPSTVRFTALHISPDTAGTAGGAKVEGTGLAKSFNALAAASGAFAEDGRIKDAIFSNIIVNKDNSVTFSLAATLDPGIIAFLP